MFLDPSGVVYLYEAPKRQQHGKAVWPDKVMPKRGAL